MKFLRAAVVLLVSAVALVGLARPAQADPHGLYYTAIGQQQLFFNVLAALDQADYVEQPGEVPTEDEDTSDPVFTRSEIAERLEASDIASEVASHPGLQSTVTGLAGTITRSVTVDGADLWTAYLLNQRAKEDDRRKALSELGEELCNTATGGCDGPLTEDQVFVTDPERAPNELETASLGALNSGNSVYEQLVLREYRRNISSGLGGLVPPNENMAALWDSVQGDDQKSEILTQAVSRAQNALGEPTVATTMLENLEVDTSGRATYAAAPEQDRPTLLARLMRPFLGSRVYADNHTESRNERFFRTLDGLNTAPIEILEVALGGREQAARFIGDTTSPGGGRAGYRFGLEGSRDSNGDPVISGMRSRVTRPAYTGQETVSGVTSAAIMNSIPQDSVLGPDEGGEPVAKKTGLEFIDKSNPRCYAPGEDFPIKFTLKNHGGIHYRGRLFLTKIAEGEGNSLGAGGDISDPDILDDNGTASASPPARLVTNHPRYLEWQANITPNGEQTFEVRDRLSSFTTGKLAYTVVLHTGSVTTRRWRFERGSQCNEGFQLRTVEGIQDDGSGSVLGGRTDGDQPSLLGRVLAGHTGGGDDGYENPSKILVPGFKEPGIRSALDALRGDVPDQNTLEQALGR